jgi:SWI/SNF-related matrix-associated actin-dependent regulator of chromatin subfamily A3
MFKLSAKSRWCLTGTPIQNRLEDIGALFAFIRVRPFDSLAVFRRFIVIPFDESEESRSVAAHKLGLLLDSLCLRRMTDLLNLPERHNITRVLDLSKDEREQYEKTKTIMLRAIRQRAGETDTHNMFGIFQAQLQLRILCNHGTFQHSFSWANRSLLNEREDALCAIGQNGEINCSLCRQAMPILGSNRVHRKYAENCAHVLCEECLEENTRESQKLRDQLTQCPLCLPLGHAAAVVQVEDTYSKKGGVVDDYFRPSGHSSKMTALITDVKNGLMENKRSVSLFNSVITFFL